MNCTWGEQGDKLIFFKTQERNSFFLTQPKQNKGEYILAWHVNLAQISVCCIWALGPCQALTFSEQPIQSFAHILRAGQSDIPISLWPSHIGECMFFPETLASVNEPSLST
jgi:hypothetical protein